MAEQKKHQETLNMEQAISRSEAFIEKNSKLLIGIVVALVVIAGAIVSYQKWYVEPREAKAQVALFPGQNYFEQNEFSKALQGDSIGYIGFLAIADEYSGTDAGNLAKAYAGICYKQLGEYDKALEQLNAFKGNDLIVSPALLGAVGNCYAELGQLDKAVNYLLKGADASDTNTLSPILLLQAGLIYEQQGKYAEAEKVYTTIKDKYFSSYQAMSIDQYIERAKLQKK